MVLISTPGAPDANSFVDYAEALVLLEGWLRTDAFVNATQATAEAALIQQTTLLSVAIDWAGAVTNIDQALVHPRTGLYDKNGYYVESDVIAPDIKLATAVASLRALEGDRIGEPGLLGKGIREVKAGPVTIKADDTSVLDLIPLEVRLLLEPFGTVKGTASKRGGTRRLKRN